MKLVINTAHQRFGGAIQVALSFINECRKYNEHEYIVWVGPGIRKLIHEKDYPANFSFKYFDFGKINFMRTFKINRTLQQEEKQIKPDCIISTSGPTYFHSQAPQIIGYNLPLYIYSESPFLHTLSSYRKIRLRLKKALHFYYFKRDATAYVVQTDDVNNRVRKALRTDRVHTVTNTHNGFYSNWQKFPDKLPPKEPGKIRLLTISAYYGHKNLEIIPLVVQELAQQGVTHIEFVLTLAASDFAAKINPKKNIINVGPIKPAGCPSLYAECDIMFLPTLAECFSASYPEAMVMKKPIITTDLGFARSICGEAALYFEPMNPKAAADRIIELIADKSLCDQLTEKGKRQLTTLDTAAMRAEKYLDICEMVVKDHSVKV